MNQGLDLAAWERRHGRAFDQEFGAALEPSRRAGSVEQRGGSLALTPKGRLLSNQVFMSLL